MKKNTKRSAQQAMEVGDELPKWVTKDPQEVYYRLQSVLDSDGFDQEIEITREEYVALKAHLIELRGYIVPKVA